MTAVERGVELLKMPMRNLPPLALEFAKHLCSQVGGCMEVFLTAYACYAQAVEGLPCDDDLYQIRPDHQAWFDQKKHDEPVLVEDGK